jgi:hypothetical protein
MRLALLAAAILAVSAPSWAAQPETAAAVIAADNSWSQFELNGDAAQLTRLLLPGYVSIGPDGKVTTREQLIGRAKARTPADLSKMRDQVQAWKAAHPLRPDVWISGDTAVLKWVAAGDPKGTVRSCDVFAYRNGEWHAIYSQHSSAST